MAAAKAWGDTLTPQLESLEGVGSVRITVTTRYYASGPPSWSVLATAIVLDAAAARRLREALSNARPPSPFRVEVLNAYGDAEFFKKLAALEKVTNGADR